MNLSSERVRVALTILDGMRQGQSLGALLGYRFERGLHDRHGQAGWTSSSRRCACSFRCVAGKIDADRGRSARRADDIGQVEARNVIDGLALVRHLTPRRRPPSRSTPSTPVGLPTGRLGADRSHLTAEAARLLDDNDAVADLAVAESAHQALAGNVERASATLDAYAKDGLPPGPPVVETPRSGTTLTHRFGLRVAGRTSARTTARRSPQQAAGAGRTGRRRLAVGPAAVAAVRGRAGHLDRSGGRRRPPPGVTQDDLDLAPIDLLWAVRPAGAGRDDRPGRPDPRRRRR